MTRNRTAIDMLASLGTQLTAVLLIAMATVLAVSRYIALGRERMRRVELRIRRRAARGTVA